MVQNQKSLFIASLSAHAGQDELVEYVSGMNKGTLKDIFLVHGELEQAEALEQQLRKSGYRNIHIPNRGDTKEYEI